MNNWILTLVLFWGLGCGNAAPPSSAADTTQAPHAPTQASEAAVPLERRDVLYYYRQLRAPHSPGYPLTQENGQWTSVSPDTQEPLPALVDIKNGFIEIVDPGTGGGEWTYRIVLFRMADGNPVIGVTHTFFDGAGLQHTYFFLRPEDSKRLDWTRETIKAVSAFDFLPADNAEEEHIVQALLPVSLELPRQGTSVKAVVFTGLEQIYCRDTDNEYADYCGLFTRVQHKEIVFKWNRDKGTFEPMTGNK
jgi:hypothetical protein